VLYVSDSPRALIEECKLISGQVFCVLQFEHLPVIEEDLNCITLGIEPHHAIRNNPEMHKIKDFWNNFYGKEYPKFQLITSNLHKVFIREDNNNSSVYDFSSLLCDKLLFGDNQIDAIFYPSIANNGAWRNYAIQPDQIFKAYEVKKAVLFQLTENNSFKWIDGGIVENDESISWGQEVSLDSPVGVGISRVDINDPELYIHPFKK